MHYMDANKTYEEKIWRQLHKNATSNTELVLEPTIHKTAVIQLPTTHHENYPSKTNQACWFDLVSLFNGISTFVGYLMPKLFWRTVVVLFNP